MKCIRRAGILAGFALLAAGGCTSELPPTTCAPAGAPPVPPVPPVPVDAVLSPVPAVDEFKGKYVALSYVAGEDVADVVLPISEDQEAWNAGFLRG